ncbi:MAG TPA: hypothetical protein PKE35_13625 [Anaerolineales bacterium]|nr:hypothetical protein [Anaerolineales bacterium]HMX18924.1 hypothetical protein [Anaerolineales bacterium]HMX75290.1 hypothetical protein [Anaerolineales bacterium]HMZ42652.1 hypothetical protein [Anaerolineales bacterium]HNA54737.1 hypothetical protein [Anaerolineales bacterium]
MFNFFKKKEKKPETSLADALRDVIFGVAPATEWPKGDTGEHPWSVFIEARRHIMERQNFEEAAKLYKQITETPGLESRHYLQAWFFLRKMNIQPPADMARKAYGIVVDVRLQSGPELVACYADHTARYLHSSGGGIVWEAPDTSLNDVIDALIRAGDEVASKVPPLENNIRPNAPQQVDAVQIGVLTPSGIHHGIGTFEGWSKDPMGSTIVNAASYLMQNLVNKKKS